MVTESVMPASELDFDQVDHFSRGEFPGDVLEHVEADFILGLSEYRKRLGKQIAPSPVIAGWYRLKGRKGSRHYAVDRLSDAGDIFPQCDIRDALLVAMACDWWGGIGVYLDTTGPSGKPEPMMHLDGRDNRVIWMRYEGRYIYPLRSTAEREEFWKRLSEVGDG